MFFGSKKDALLAIDLATDAVRVLDVRLRAPEPIIQAYASQSIEAGPVTSLPERHLEALRSLLNNNRFSTKNVFAAMPSALVVTRSVALDAQKNQSDEEQVRYTLNNCLPFDAKDLMFDYWQTSPPQNGNRTRDVLVVATQASVVQRYLTGFEKLGLDCSHMDVAPCALATLIKRTASQPENMIGVVALSETGGFFSVVENNKVLFWRPFDLPASAANKSNAGIHNSLDRVGDEISKCVSHMVGSMHLDNMNELQLFGTGADNMVVAEYLKNRFHMPVRNPSPFDALSNNACPPAIREALGNAAASHYCTAVGLAMQGAAAHG